MYDSISVCVLLFTIFNWMDTFIVGNIKFYMIVESGRFLDINYIFIQLCFVVKCSKIQDINMIYNTSRKCFIFVFGTLKYCCFR